MIKIKRFSELSKLQSYRNLITSSCIYNYIFTYRISELRLTPFRYDQKFILSIFITAHVGNSPKLVAVDREGARGIFPMWS